MHLHLDENNCMLVIALKGDAADVEALAKAITAKRGVVQVKLSVVQG